jgi:hypothetical protein
MSRNRRFEDVLMSSDINLLVMRFAYCLGLVDGEDYVVDNDGTFMYTASEHPFLSMFVSLLNSEVYGDWEAGLIDWEEIEKRAHDIVKRVDAEMKAVAKQGVIL